MTLKELGIGQKGIILSVGGSGALRQHFLDMGLIRGAEVTVVKYAPMGDPIELKIHGYELTIRLDDAEKIEVKEIKSEEKEKEDSYVDLASGLSCSSPWRMFLVQAYEFF